MPDRADGTAIIFSRPIGSRRIRAASSDRPDGHRISQDRRARGGRAQLCESREDIEAGDIEDACRDQGQKRRALDRQAPVKHQGGAEQQEAGAAQADAAQHERREFAKRDLDRRPVESPEQREEDREEALSPDHAGASSDVLAIDDEGRARRDRVIERARGAVIFLGLPVNAEGALLLGLLLASKNELFAAPPPRASGSTKRS